VCTVAEYFLLGSMTVGGGVVLFSIQVTIPLSQPEGEAGAVASPPESQPAMAINSSAESSPRFTAETLPER
jgi:hypothetical protein